MHIIDAEDREWKVYREYCDALKRAGCTEIQETQLHSTVLYITKRLKPQKLYKRMMDIIKWRESENFRKEHFPRFRREVAKQAEQLHGEHIGTPVHNDRVENSHIYNEQPKRSQRHHHEVRRHAAVKK